MTIFLITLESIGIISGACFSIAILTYYYFDRRLNIRVLVTDKPIRGHWVGDVSSGNTFTPSYPGIQITAANLSWKRSTTLGKLQLSLPRGETPLRSCSRTPSGSAYEIGPGSQELTIRCDKDELIKTLREKGYSSCVPFRAVLSGPGGQKYRSNEMWLNMENGLIEDRSLRARLARM